MSENTMKKNEQEQDGTNNISPSMKNFICDEYSICREERQYVVFLYDILRKYAKPESRKKTEDQIGKVEEIFKVCGLEDNAIVEKVFYEPAFMRDFFERNRRLVLTKNIPDREKKILQNDSTIYKEQRNFEEKESFNVKLIEYVCKQKPGVGCTKNIKVEYSGYECNLGQNKNWAELEKLRILNENCEDIGYKFGRSWIESKVRPMMNAQPDIAVIYHIGEEKKKNLLFIECKYLSRESTYTYITNGEKESEKQRKIQWMIADFLCNYLFENEDSEVEMKLSSGMKEKQSRLVKFVRGRETKAITENEDTRGEIFLKDLIECEKRIFPL